MKKHNEFDVITSLNKKNDTQIIGSIIWMLSEKVFNPKTLKIEDNPHKKHDIGKGSWGKIDFLLSRGFTIQRIASFKNLN